MADQKKDLEPLGRLPIKRQQSRASVTAQDYLGTGSMMRKSFVDLQNSDEFKKDTEAQIDKYDTNNDGTFDRAEVERIVMAVKEKAHEAEQTVLGAKRIAENLNDSKVRPKWRRVEGDEWGAGLERRRKENGRAAWTRFGMVWWCGTLFGDGMRECSRRSRGGRMGAGGYYTAV